MNAENIKEVKRTMRKEIIFKRRQLTASYVGEADLIIANHTMALPEFKSAETIFCFVSMKEEIDTFPILNRILEDGKNLVVPRCISPGIMSAFHIEGLHQLSVSGYGILEPDKSLRIADPKEIDFAIIPCLSCDINGRRLGHGGGYYDRYLSNADFRTAVICREKLMSKEIPLEAWDQTMDIVITEKRIINLTS